MSALAARAAQFRAARDGARARGDAGVYRAMTIELERLGAVEAVREPAMPARPAAGRRRRREAT